MVVFAGFVWSSAPLLPLLWSFTSKFCLSSAAAPTINKAFLATFGLGFIADEDQSDSEYVVIGPNTDPSWSFNSLWAITVSARGSVSRYGLVTHRHQQDQQV